MNIMSLILKILGYGFITLAIITLIRALIAYKKEK